MATPDQLRTLITARPFQPFIIKMGSGERFNCATQRMRLVMTAAKV